MGLDLCICSTVIPSQSRLSLELNGMRLTVYTIAEAHLSGGTHSIGSKVRAYIREQDLKGNWYMYVVWSILVHTA